MNKPKKTKLGVKNRNHHVSAQFIDLWITRISNSSLHPKEVSRNVLLFICAMTRLFLPDLKQSVSLFTVLSSPTYMLSSPAILFLHSPAETVESRTITCFFSLLVTVVQRSSTTQSVVSSRSRVQAHVICWSEVIIHEESRGTLPLGHVGSVILLMVSRSGFDTMSPAIQLFTALFDHEILLFRGQRETMHTAETGKYNLYFIHGIHGS